MPLQATAGAATYDAFGGGPLGPFNYIEDVFSTYLYTGNGSTQTITNGIDLAGKGGLVWVKDRSHANSHCLNDSTRSNIYGLRTNTTDAETQITDLTSYSASGFSLGFSGGLQNTSGHLYASWTFRKQAKFFDVVTYTGNGSNRTISHSLGSVPGCIIVKRTDTAADWQVYHRSLANTEYVVLNDTAAKATGTTRWNSTTPTSTVFSIGTDTTVNANGGTYVAYLFAHDAGGFGASGTDNVISCGSYTGNGSATGPTVTLGYEPQWVMIKNTSQAGNWNVVDALRGFAVGGDDAVLFPNLTNTEASAEVLTPLATGFQLATAGSAWNTNGDTYIYIAIRRGPMRTPTSGTSVFTPSTTGATNNITVGFPADTYWIGRDAANWRCFDRLRSGYELATNTTSAEGGFNYFPTNIHWDSNSVWNQNLQNAPLSNFFLRRAPGFFDVVCFTGSSVNRTYNHNLGIQPELIIVKGRSGSYGSGDWSVATNQGAKAGESIDTTKNHTGFELNSTAAVNFGTSQNWSDLCSTTTFTTNGLAFITNSSGNTAQWSDSSTTFVAYLFATVAGVSKVGSYTGTGTTLQVNCGFTAGARFVLIKRTDSTGDWYVYNSADGIVSGNDPYRILNGTTLTSGTDYVDTYSAGFEISSTAPAAINANGGTFIFLAIA